MSHPAPPSTASPRQRKIAWLCLAMTAGVVLGLAATFGISAFARRGWLPVLTDSAFDAARQRWQQNGPDHYNVVATVTGRQSATYRVEVRGGEVLQALRNGLPLRQRRTMGTWSVPGMFGTISADLESQHRIAAGTADRNTPHVRLRAAFDRQLGYPIRYHRMEVRSGGNYEVSWEVEFESLAPQTVEP